MFFRILKQRKLKLKQPFNKEDKSKTNLNL